MNFATNIEEQINILEDRGMIIRDQELAKNILFDVGFYHFGFYAFPFEINYPDPKNRNHEYKKDTTFESVFELYKLDYKLKHIILKCLWRIEENFKTKLIYIVSNYYKNEPTWFAHPNIVSKVYIDQFEEKVYKEIKKNPVIKRHHQKYVNHKYAPAWKVIEFMTLGNICYLYKNLKDENIKQQIANCYDIRQNSIFESYLEIIRNIRNACSHGNRIFDINFSLGVKKGAIKELQGNYRHNICGAILVMLYLTKTFSSNLCNELKMKIQLVVSKFNNKEVIHELVQFNNNILTIPE